MENKLTIHNTLSEIKHAADGDRRIGALAEFLSEYLGKEIDENMVMNAENKTLDEYLKSFGLTVTKEMMDELHENALK